MTKKNFRYHKLYDKSASACIDLSHVVSKKKNNNKKIASKLCARETNWES